MTIINVRRALETRLRDFAVSVNVPVAWENVDFAAPAGPYMASNILFAEPDDMGFRDAPFIQRGYMQVTLFYPPATGPHMAHNIAVAIRDLFFRGSSMVAETQAVNVERTPEITGGSNEEGRFVVRVRIRFYAEIDPQSVTIPIADLDPSGMEW